MRTKKPSRARVEITELAKAMRDSGTLDEATYARIATRRAQADTVKP